VAKAATGVGESKALAKAAAKRWRQLAAHGACGAKA